MNSISKLSAVGSLMIAGLLTSPNMLSAQETLPDGTGRNEFRRMCSSCHATSTATNQRKAVTGWTATVNDMVTRGAQGTPSDVEKVIVYLSSNFGADKPLVKQETVAAEQTPSLSAGETTKARDIILANGCLSCHSMRGEGSYIGPDLGDIGAHRTAEQIRTAIVSPPQIVQPENRGIRIVTKSGQTINGRILNQDAITVQFIDSSRILRSFKQADLEECTILDQNPMPSYTGKLSDEDLVLLVKYFSSLKEPNSP
jgi:putative heme-binding domain-containing protein